MILLAMVIFCGCKSSPPLQRQSSGEYKLVSIAELKSAYLRNPVLIDEEVEICGRIVSTDYHRNHYNTIILQDESGGIEIKLDMEEISVVYHQWYRMTVSCNSLTLDNYSGVFRLTDAKDYISASKADVIFSQDLNSFEEPLPERVTIDGLQAKHVSCYIQIDGVQFADEHLGMSWSEPEASTNRYIVDRYGRRIAVRTSGYATFASRLLPTGSGSIKGILSRFNGEYRIIVNDFTDAIMTSRRF